MSKLSLIPVKEMVDTVTIVKQTKIAKEGGWAKIKRGKYKGDIGQVLAVLCSGRAEEGKVGRGGLGRWGDGGVEQGG